jgi:hypothetical protein
MTAARLCWHSRDDTIDTIITAYLLEEATTIYQSDCLLNYEFHSSHKTVVS